MNEALVHSKGDLTLFHRTPITAYDGVDARVARNSTFASNVVPLRDVPGGANMRAVAGDAATASEVIPVAHAIA